MRDKQMRAALARPNVSKSLAPPSHSPRAFVDAKRSLTVARDSSQFEEVCGILGGGGTSLTRAKMVFAR